MTKLDKQIFISKTKGKKIRWSGWEKDKYIIPNGIHSGPFFSSKQGEKHGFANGFVDNGMYKWEFCSDQNKFDISAPITNAAELEAFCEATRGKKIKASHWFERYIIPNGRFKTTTLQFQAMRDDRCSWYKNSLSEWQFVDEQSNNDAVDSTCSHSWVTYIGLNDKFNYCSHCDIRKE